MSRDDNGGATHGLIGRKALVAGVNNLLDARRSVLLFGPPGIGKSAIVAAVSRQGLVVADPFDRVSRPLAARLRRVMEADGIVLAAGRSAKAADLGAVRRVLWRMEAVRVEPLAARDISTLLRISLKAGGVPRAAVSQSWLSDAVKATQGVPGRAVAVAHAVAARWRDDRGLLPPRLALVVSWQDGLAGAGHVLTKTVASPPGGRHDATPMSRHDARPQPSHARARLAGVRAVVFDMNELLVDTEGIHAAATRQVLAAFGVAYDEHDRVEFCGVTDYDMFRVLKRRHRLQESEEELCRRNAAAVAGRVGEGPRQMPGVPDVPLELRRRGYLVAVASSSDHGSIRALLDRVGLRDSIDLVVSGAEVPRGKPAPDVFLEAAIRLGVEPSGCLVVEDAPAGLAAARAAGMPCVIVPCDVTRDTDFSGATLLLRELPELLSYLPGPSRGASV
ncbi:MAG: HAD-IA family hydrolase [Acidobacteria bacterium]|nr:HAD-IA family hydrolase [Acidobacteriota bacterium]